MKASSQQPQSASNGEKQFRSFSEFYPFYLHQHRNLTCRRLHFVGTALVILLTVTAFASANFLWLATLPLAGYGFAWVGHFFFEHNRPATFKYPLYSLWGDFVMFKDMLLGRIER
ncbi:Mpo1-like protein [Microbulbifer sp. 2201CG32-9]|uniref:Mpo1-like protein n=1 Tax=unclassified Microbulbifer TaxID=2619833 RepID=UPI00345C6031